MIKLIGNEKLINNVEVSAGDDILVTAKVQHNYPALSNQAKMMITGKFNLAQQWLFKSGSEPFNDDGEVIDYSGEGNDAGLDSSYCAYMNAGTERIEFPIGTIRNLINGAGIIEFEFTANVSTNSTVKMITYACARGGARDFQVNFFGSRIVMIIYTGSSPVEFLSTTGVVVAGLHTYKLKIDVPNDITYYYRDSELVYSRTTAFSGTTFDPPVSTTADIFLDGYYGNPFIGFISDIKFYADSNLVFYMPLAEGSGSTVYDVVNESTGTITGSIFAKSNLSHYNITHGFTDDTVYIPYNIDGNPIAVSGTNHPAGNYHNGAETKITLENYGAKSYDEMISLAIADNRFELVEDEDGNLSEIKITKLTETDTEHYTVDNNNLQALTESGNLTSPINQTVKLLIQGGDNDNVAATGTITFPSGAQITDTATIAGEDGNNIQRVYVEGVTRGISILEGSTIVITITYEAGDLLSDLTVLMDTVGNLITYVVNTDGEVSDLSGTLEGGFTNNVDITELDINGETIFPIAEYNSYSLPLKSQVKANQHVKTEVTTPVTLNSKVINKNVKESSIGRQALDSHVKVNYEIESKIK